MIGQLLRRVRTRLSAGPRDSDLDSYHQNGRRPWSRGYVPFKEQFISRTLADADLLERFRTQQPLPEGYGEFLDERVVEYPWLFTRLTPANGRLLDAGSALNHSSLLGHPFLADKKLSIVTLAPESQCHWQRGISYVFADLRDLPFRDGYFDEVVSVSTLEHVGKDNTLIYTTEPRFNEDNGLDFITAARELKRVCKPGGKISITVPFGRFTDFGWYQQFDADLLDRLIGAFEPVELRETFFRYADGGWQHSTRRECAACEGFNIHATRYMNPRSTGDYDPDYAAASRGIAALEMWKGSPA